MTVSWLRALCLWLCDGMCGHHRQCLVGGELAGVLRRLGVIPLGRWLVAGLDTGQWKLEFASEGYGLWRKHYVQVSTSCFKNTAIILHQAHRCQDGYFVSYAHLALHNHMKSGNFLFCPSIKWSCLASRALVTWLPAVKCARLCIRLACRYHTNWAWNQISRDAELQVLHSYGASTVWWATGWWNNYTGLALQEAHTNINVILPFRQGSHFFVFWSPCDCDVSPSLTNPPSFYRSKWSIWWLKHLCGVTWDSSLTVVVIKLQRTSALWKAEITWSKVCLSQTAAWDPNCHCWSAV